MTPSLKSKERVPIIPTRETALAELVKSLQEIKGFSIYFAVCNSASERKSLQQEAISLLGPDFPVETVAIMHPVKSLYHYLKNNFLTSNPKIIFITGIEQWLPSDEAAENSTFIANLNHHRNSFSKINDCSFVFWITDTILRTIAIGASDFFSIRSNIFIFPSLINEEQPVKFLYNSEGEFNTLFSLTVNERKDWIDLISDRIEYFKKSESSIKNSIDLANALTTQGYLFTISEDYSSAFSSLTEALTIRKRYLGEKNLDTARSIHGLAVLNLTTGNYEIALKLFEDEFQIKKEILGENHLETIRSINGIARVYNNTGHYEKSLKLFNHVLKIREKDLGLEHPDIAQVFSNLAELKQNMGESNESLFFFKRALDIQEKILGLEHPITANSLHSISILLFLQGKLQESYNFMKRAHEIYVKVLGEQHTETQKVQGSLFVIETMLQFS